MRLLGSYAALLGLVHGIAAIGQGPGVVPSIPFLAVGPPCQPDASWHGCLPAVTLVPDVQLSGMLAVLASAVLAATALRPRRRPGRAMAVMALGLAVVGGGFVPPVIAGFAAYVAPSAPTPGVDPGRPPPIADAPWRARWWPWPLVAYAGLVAGQLAAGLAGRQELIGVAPLLLAAELALLALSVATARAHDRWRLHRPPDG